MTPLRSAARSSSGAKTEGSWLLPELERDAVRVRIAPQWVLAAGGDDVETLMERHGFQRRRMMGGWSTLLTDISLDEAALLHTFRRQARQNVANQFKRGFAPGTEPLRLVAPHEKVVRPALHEVYLAARRAEAKYRKRRSQPAKCSEIAGG